MLLGFVWLGFENRPELDGRQQFWQAVYVSAIQGSASRPISSALATRYAAEIADASMKYYTNKARISGE